MKLKCGVGEHPFLIIYFMGTSRISPKRRGRDSTGKSRIRKRSINYTCINDVLYRCSCDDILLCCLAGSETIEALNEVHAGTCGAHQSGHKLHYQLRHLGYYWPTMFDDSMKFAKRCHQCRKHGNFIHQPHEPLQPTNISWPFEMRV